MRLSPLLFLFVALPAVAFAQNRPFPGQNRNATPAAAAPGASPAPDQARVALWKCELPGGMYEVAIRAIISVSSHDYTVDNTARVTEVNVETNGSTAVRFYYIEPVGVTAPLGIGQSALDRVQELAKEASGRVGADQFWQKVVKNYPTTTHAHTVEYRLDSKDQLTQLFASLERAFRTGQAASIKLP